MKLSKCIIRRFRGVPGEAIISFSDHDGIVGRNDLGKLPFLRH